MANLLDLMTPEDREAVEVAFKKRMSGDNTFRKGKVSRVAYLLAELGMLYGWEAIVAAKRGYIETFDEHTMQESFVSALAVLSVRTLTKHFVME